MMLRAIIVDDEETGINALRILIESTFDSVKIVAHTTNPVDAISLIENYQPDIVFLDISMPKMNGFELLEKLSFKSFKLVFTTAHESYALQAIKNKAYDYILKPLDRTDVKNCVENIIRDYTIKQSETKPRSLIELPAKDGIVFIKPEEIIRLEASGSYTVFHLENNNRYVASKNLKECTGLLENWDYFFRSHSSHTVNLKKIVKLVSSDGLYIKMTDGSMPELLRKNKEALLQRLQNI